MSEGISKYKCVELSMGDVTLKIERANFWEDTEIHINGTGSGKACLSSSDLRNLKSLIEEYEDNYKDDFEGDDE